MRKDFKFLFIISLALMAISCSEEPRAKKKYVRPVKYQEVGFSGDEQERSFSGTAQTDKIIQLSFRSAGIITKLNIKLGQRVKKGELLSSLDNVQSRLSLEQAYTQLNSAKSQMNTAKLNLNRIRTLYEKGAASLSDYESSKNSYRTATEGFESSKRSVEIQKEQVQYGFLYAPEDGVIAAVNAEIDENVSPGQNIATLNAGTDMEISIGVPEIAINSIKEEMEVGIQFPALGEALFKGLVTEVSPSVDSNSATYPVTIKVVKPSRDMRSGMAANVFIQFTEDSREDDTLVVPANAVGEDSNGNFVFLIEESGNTFRVKKTIVDIGPLTSEGFIIHAGLSKGQKIATAGLQTLLDNQEVRLQ